MQAVLRHSGLLIRADQGIQFYANESLARVVLAEESLIDGVPCAAGEEVEFHRTGRLAAATLAHPTMVRGLPAAPGSPLSFFSDGSPRFLVLSRERRIQGFPAAAGSLFLHADGAVWNALAASSLLVGGHEFSAGTRMTIGASGGLCESWQILQVDTELRGLPCSARFPVWTWPNGALSCVHLAQPCQIDGHRLPVHTEVLSEPDGSLRAARRRRYPAGVAVPWRVLGAVEDPIRT